MIFMDIGITDPVVCFKPVRAFSYEGRLYTVFETFSGDTAMWVNREGVWYPVEDSRNIIEKGDIVPTARVRDWIDCKFPPRLTMLKRFAGWLYKIAYRSEIELLVEEIRKSFNSSNEKAWGRENYRSGAINGLEGSLRILNLWYISDELY